MKNTNAINIATVAHKKFRRLKPDRIKRILPQRNSEKNATAAASLFTEVIKSVNPGKSAKLNGRNMRSACPIGVSSFPIPQAMRSVARRRIKDTPLAAYNWLVTSSIGKTFRGREAR